MKIWMKVFVLAFVFSLVLQTFVSCGEPKGTETDGPTNDSESIYETEGEKETMASDNKITVDEIGNGKHVMTFVMGQERSTLVSGKWQSWSDNNHKPDTAKSSGLRDIASIYYPSIGLYDVTDPDYQEYMMQLCKMCYVDTINYYVKTPEDISDQTLWGKNFDKLTVEMLRKYGLSSTARLANFPTDYDNEAGKALSSLLEKLGDTVLTIDGRPVLAQFSMRDMKPAQVISWKKDYADAHGGIQPFLMTWQHGDYQQSAWMNVSDGQYGWVELDDSKVQSFWKNGVYLSYADLKTAKTNHDNTIEKAKRYIEQGLVSFYAEAVTPAFDSLGCWGWGKGPSKVEGGENGELYEYKWKAAVENDFPMVVIPTWDDWGEASTIEPSLEYGVKLLEITRKYAAEYKEIEANTASLELPGWIYKIRKTTKDSAILAVMDKASQYIADSRYEEAEALVKPYVASVGIPAASTEYFNYPKIYIAPPPVVEDDMGPTVEGNTVTWTAVADTYVQQNSIDDFGANNTLRVKSDAKKGLSRNAFIKFDLSGVTVESVARATLRLYCQFASESATEIANRDYKLYAVNSEWQESGMQWSTQPKADGKISDIDTKKAKKGTWIEVDITEYVNAHLGETISFMICNEGEASNENHINFSSRESKGQEPQIVLQTQ